MNFWRSRFAIALATGLVAIGSARLLLGRAEAANARASGLADSAMLARDIRFYEERVQGDPWSAADLAQLAGLYLQRGRETGEIADLVRGEDTARRSLTLREARNGKAALVLASVLLARHRFPEALEVARELCQADPTRVSSCALYGEIQLEMGDYDGARHTFAALSHARTNLAVAPRLARWSEILGATDAARRLLQGALAEARQRPDLPREQLAWFYLRVADLELRNGGLRDAERAFRNGLRVAPDDRRLLAGMARLEAVRHHWRKAIRYGERALATVPDPGTLALVGDAYAEMGDTIAAERYFAAVERSAVEAPEPFNRAWTQFRLDHGRRVPETLALLRDEVQVRRDVYGYDQLAWALYRAGDYRAAREAMAAALRLGTRDAVLHFHAGMIEKALGEYRSTLGHLSTALEINPYFHHEFAPQARAAADSLAAENL
ncbi:MAG: hypothetical protein HY337_07790 [Gemmatimonadetes bacterium]|nr:hypothetical protein [Gemmatimonadota bacterium]